MTHRTTAALAIALAPTLAAAGSTVSFLVDPDTIDGNNDGFITGNEFAPLGSDGTLFQLTPTNNLVGGDRFLLSDDRGIHFGGGGGSTLSFDFTADQSVELETYTISSNGFILGNPTFDIQTAAGPLSTGNNADTPGTHAFSGGSILIDAGETYTFNVTNSGAGIQSFMESWNYTLVPAPAGVGALAIAGLAAARRRR